MSAVTRREDDRKLLGQVSAERLMASTRAIARWVRLSGTPDEAKAFDWIASQLVAYGYDTARYAHPGLVSWPESASLAISGSAGPPQRLSCATHAFAASTGDEGLEAEVVPVGRATPGDLSRSDLRGTLAFVEGVISPERNLMVERAGAAGSIWAAGPRLHERILSPVWGTPTPETAPLLPHTPSVSLTEDNAAPLRERLRRGGPVRARLTTRVFRGWKQLPCLVGELRAGSDAPDASDFVMLSGHVDSWYYGAVDNGSANAGMLEAAYVLATRRPSLRRGFRVAFWSGHSHARYGGSAWYADAFWHDLHDRCVAHVNADSLGERGAVDLTSACVMAQLRAFAGEVVREVTGQEFVGRRVSRAGDQSFWGHGIPSLFMLLSEQAKSPSGERGGHAPWWHTPDDTVDKVDIDFLVRDAQVYALACARLCEDAILPFEYGEAIRDLAAAARELQDAAGGHLDLSPVTSRLALLEERAEALRAPLARLRGPGSPPSPAVASRINAGFKRLGSALVPVDYSGVDRFDQDPAVALPSLPALRPAADLAAMTPGTDAYEFLRTRLLRNRNRIVFALREAESAVDDLLAAAAGR